MQEFYLMRFKIFNRNFTFLLKGKKRGQSLPNNIFFHLWKLKHQNPKWVLTSATSATFLSISELKFFETS
jgi:hypothetical protein